MIPSTSVKVWNGTQENAVTPSVYVAPEKPASVGVVPWGYQSWDALIAARPLFVAHRGGSANWPEMSMKAYTNCAAWGVPVLELSANPTSDGVWVGVHDQTLNRTSQTTGLPNVTEMTWEQVQQYRNLMQGGNEPYERIETILEAYSATHAFFIDPKYGFQPLARLQSLFTVIKRYPGWEKHVIKFFYDSSSVANAAHAAGFHTWGYYYEAGVPDIPSTAGLWDILGMDQSASQASWNAVLAPGKPVLSHILSSQASWTTSQTKGAHGAMVSGVQQIIPGGFG